MEISKSKLDGTRRGFAAEYCGFSRAESRTLSLIVCCGILAVGWLFSTGLFPSWVQKGILGEAGADHGRPGYKVIRHVEANDGLHGGHYVLEPNYTLLEPNGQQFDGQHACFELAKQTEQPVTDIYRRRHAPPQPLPGGVPRSFFQWEGNITREEFDGVLPDLEKPGGCWRCGYAIKYQIIRGHLYRQGSKHELGDKDWLVQEAEDLLLAALYFWDIPDMDFIMRFADACPSGQHLPVFSWNVCRDRPKAGWAFPSYTAWIYALGPHQFQVYHQCLANRYPMPSRNRVVLWRGSTTDTKYNGFTMKMVDKVTRMRIHKEFAGDPVVDAKLSRIIHSDDCVKEYLGPLGPNVPLEDFNTAAVIMDVDGNGWSDRFSRTVHFPSVILKQASNHTAFFEHLVAPGNMIESFQNDLGNLKERAYATIAEWVASPERLLKQVARRQGMAIALLNHVSVAEAMGYGLLEYSKRLSWQVAKDDSYTPVPFSRACMQGKNALPQAVCALIKAS